MVELESKYQNGGIALPEDLIDAEDRADTELLASLGYRQELRRAVGWFSSFALSYSGLSITTGVFLLLPFVYATAGTAGIWTFPISTAGAVLVVLVFSDLVGRLPLAGYAYQWSRRLTDIRLGWYVAVAALTGYVIGTAGTIFGVAPYFLTEVGITVSTGTQIAASIVLMVAVTAINIAGVRLAARINNVAVVTEILGAVVVALVLLIFAIANHPHPASFLFQKQIGQSGAYWPTFLLAFLLGAFAYSSWELPADLAEETKHATRIPAQTMLIAIAVVGVSGMILLVGYTYASPSLQSASSSTTPVLSAISYQWGDAAKSVFNVVFLISFFSAILLAPAAAGRIIFSMARDGVLPMSSHLAGVSKRFRTPHRALILVSAFAIVMFAASAVLSATALSYLIGTASVGYNIVYWLMTGIFFYGLRRNRLPQQHGTFSLGRWASIVSGAAFLWQTFLVIDLTVTPGNQPVGLTTLGIFAIATIWYFVRIRGLHSAAKDGNANAVH